MRNLTGKFSRKPSDSNHMDRQEQYDAGKTGKTFATESIQEDFFAPSEITPENTFLSRPSTKRAIWIILALLVVSLSSWFCFIGPGAPSIKSYLESSADRTSPAQIKTFTPTVSIDATLDQEESSQKSAEIQPEETKTPTPTVSPTSTANPTETSSPTPTQTTEPSPTPVPILNTSTPTSEVAGCVPASEVKISDVGTTLCVSGRVVRTIDKPAGFLIILVEEPEAFYFVAYDLKFPNLEDPKNKNQCVYAIGEIRQLGNNPIMVVSYSVPLQYCTP